MSNTWRYIWMSVEQIVSQENCLQTISRAAQDIEFPSLGFMKSLLTASAIAEGLDASTSKPLFPSEIKSSKDLTRAATTGKLRSHRFNHAHTKGFR